MSALNGTPLRVAADASAVRISGWSTSDPEILSGARTAVGAGQSLEAWFERALQIGARALNAASGSIDHSRVDAAIQQLEQRIQSTVGNAVSQLTQTVSRVTDPERGDVARASQQAIDRLAVGVQKVLTGPDALLPDAAANALRRVTDQAVAEVHRALEADRRQLTEVVTKDRDRIAVEVAKAVSVQAGEYREVMAELRDLLAVRAAEEARDASGPRKGHTYEQAAHEALHAVASASGDGGASFTGGTAGLENNRKGDSLVVLRSLNGPERRIAVEAKNRPNAVMTPAQWADELAAVLRNRGASVAIGVCPFDQVPGDAGLLVIDPTRIVLGWEPEAEHLLSPVFLLARMAAQVLSRGQGDEDRTRELMLFLSSTLTPLADISKHAHSARRALDKIQHLAGTLSDGVTGRIEASGGPRTIVAAA